MEHHVESQPADGPRVLILLCTYNEVDNLPQVFDSLDQHLPAADILVVDDNSPDGTADVVRRRAEQDSRVHLLLRAHKQGLGRALRAGIAWFLERQYDYLINLDADLSHDPASTPIMLKACLDSTADVALGSRYIPGGDIPGLAWHRRWISRCLNAYATRVLRLPISDCSGSFRCYSREALEKVDLDSLHCGGYGFLEEILVALHRGGAKLVEVPIRFEARFSGHSKLGLSDIFGVLKVIHSTALRRRQRHRAD